MGWTKLQYLIIVISVDGQSMVLPDKSKKDRCTGKNIQNYFIPTFFNAFRRTEMKLLLSYAFKGYAFKGGSCHVIC